MLAQVADAGTGSISRFSLNTKAAPDFKLAGAPSTSCTDAKVKLLQAMDSMDALRTQLAAMGARAVNPTTGEAVGNLQAALETTKSRIKATIADVRQYAREVIEKCGPGSGTPLTPGLLAQIEGMVRDADEMDRLMSDKRLTPQQFIKNALKVIGEAGTAIGKGLKDLGFGLLGGLAAIIEFLNQTNPTRQF